MKKCCILLLVAALLNALYANMSESEFEMLEAQKHKNTGFIMAGLGVLTMGLGAGALYQDYDKDNKFNSASGVMGATAIAAGIGFEVISFLQFKKSRDILKESREREALPLSLYLTPKGLTLVGSF